MRHLFRFMALGLCLLSQGGCQSVQKADPSPSAATPSATPAVTGFSLTSSAFAPNGPIPMAHTCDGGDLAPPLAWSGAPKGAARLALIIDDPDAPNPPYTHWLLYNLPTADTSLVAGGSLPFGSTEGANSFGNTSYNGPCPPAGAAHHYHFTLYALDTSLALEPGAKRAAVDAAMKGHILAQTALIGTYAHK